MDEQEWLNKVEDILKEKGVSLDMFNDGWFFMYENGFTPIQAISEMLN